MAALATVVSGNKSSPNDIDQLVQALNGVTTNIPILVSNRIQAGAIGATAVVALIGGTTTPGDANQSASPGQPTPTKVKPGAIATGANTYQVGDTVTDAAGLLWMAIGATSGGMTPWATIGRGGDNARTRSSTTTGGSAWPGADVIYGNWDFGGIQYNDASAPGNFFGFVIPVTGYYQLSGPMHAKHMSSSASYTYGWARADSASSFVNTGDGAFGDTSRLISLGDVVQGGADPGGNVSSFTDDIQFFNEGDHIAPYATYMGPSCAQGATDGTGDACTWLSLELLSGSVSS